jgi:nucleoside-diphosphate-sugar epimerase
MKNTAVVTGAEGCIISHLVKFLYAKGWNVIDALLSRISNLNFFYESLSVHLHLYLCRFERDEAASEVHTQWVTNKISPFSSRSMPR